MTKIKNGFLLIELMIGLSVSIIFILIITHYIIEVKNAQHKALMSIEQSSTERNVVEESLMKKADTAHE